MEVSEWITVGVVQTVTLGVAAWLGKLWAGSVARTHQAILDGRLKQLESRLDASTHVTKAQYDLELEIYRDLWTKLFYASGFTFGPTPIKSAPDNSMSDDEVQKETLDRATGEFSKATRELSRTIYHNRPFYAKEVFDATEPLYVIITKTLLHFIAGVDRGERFERAMSNFDKVLAHQDSIREAIRNRMQSISVV